MPEFSSATRTKIGALLTRQMRGERLKVRELVQIDWPSPDGTIYYAVAPLDQICANPPSVSPIDVRLIAGSSPDWFLPVSLDATIGDEEVDLQFSDIDGVMSDLLLAYGEGV